MAKPFLSPDGKRRLYRLLSVYATAFGACAALQQFFQPFTENAVWALVTAGAGTVVIGAVILAYVLFREHSGRRTALSVLVQVVLVVVGAGGGVLVGATLRAPVAPPASGASGGGTTAVTATTTTSVVTVTTTTTAAGQSSTPVNPVPAPTTPASTTTTTRVVIPITTTTTNQPPPPPTAFGFSTTGPVTYCTDLSGWGTVPPEGRAVILVRQVDSPNVFYEQPIDFHGDGTWTANNIYVGNPGEENDYMLTAQAMTQSDVDWYKRYYTNSQDPVSEVHGRPLGAKEFHRWNQPNTC
ncbi:hypothetical protein JOD54_003459 [Actinokineospora baliensis]|uniref:hypothetical protein n=1 Tax=Actinokineospora baliensis TaxID=547056 RepID=UPI00195DC653|nr:hypothetical protein [Actinokineospora baliensis]MBM7773255.1 hypothetical protein [Actinokineospora baliensis]